MTAHAAERMQWIGGSGRGVGPVGPFMTLSSGAETAEGKSVVKMSLRKLRSPMANDCAGSDAHYWRIATADGPESFGYCLHCEESRIFRNSFPLLRYSPVGKATLDLTNYKLASPKRELHE